MADGIVDLANWRSVNRANWDERVAVHLKTSSYDLQPLRSGCGELHAIEEGELGFVDGLRVLHLQCHFGLDTLTLAQRGAQVVGIDFSGPAIEAACNLADELGLSARAQFIECDLYHAPDVLLEPESFDLVYVTWALLTGCQTYKGGHVWWQDFLSPEASSISQKDIQQRSCLMMRFEYQTTCQDFMHHISILMRSS
jgi:hypothetical protein